MTQTNPFQQLTLQQKLKRNRQLLLMFYKLQQIQQSCWGRFFRFQKTQLFINFEKRFRVYRTVRLRIDDIIYMAILIAICIVFYLLPVHNNNDSHQLNIGYEHFLIYLIVFSLFWLMTPHWFKHIFNIGVLIIFPVLTLLVYFNIIPFDATKTVSNTQFPQSVYTFIQIFSLMPTFIALYIVYPMKEFIRNKIGSLYSYLFALSLLTLFIIWPAYSFINQYIANQTLTYSFISANQALLITFLVILTFSFHLLVHNTFFQGNLTKVKKQLLLDLTPAEILAAVEEITEEDLKQSCVYNNYEIYTRVMSGIVLAFTLGIEIYSFIFISNKAIDQIAQGISVMVFAIFFLIYGCIIHLAPVSRTQVLFFFSLISIVPALFSPLYYSQSFYRYIFLSCALPYTTIFWCIVRSLSHRLPFFKINVLVILYIWIHTPLTFYIINSFQMLTTDTTTQNTINTVIIAIVGFASLVGIVSFVVWLCTSVRQLPNQQSIRDKTINYNYHDPSNPPYIPYKKLQSFSLAWLGSLDIRNMAQLFTCVCFICSELASMYVLNELLFKIDISALYSGQILQIIYCQFVIVFMFYCYAFVYITFKPKSSIHVVVLVVMIVFGLALIGLSYGLVAAQVANITSFDFSLRLGGGAMVAIGLVGIALLFIKRRNHKIDFFLSGMLIMFLWIFLIIPYVITVPIISAYVSLQNFGMYVYYVVLFTTVLLLFLVSTISMIFNLLMGKFEEQKKIKYVMQDVQTFLKEQGVQTEDQVMHILYQSFEYRDEKYVYDMKRGYPVRLWKQQKTKKNKNVSDNAKTIVYNNQDLIKQRSLSKIGAEEDDGCWKCLTFFCGQDQQELQKKIQEIQDNSLLDEQQMQDLIPKTVLKKFILGRKNKQNQQEKKKYIDPSNIYSSKSVVLRNLKKQQKHLGQQYALLKNCIRNPQNQSYRRVAVETWNQIFSFLSNNDDTSNKIIYNDFVKFIEIIQLPQDLIYKKQIDELYLDYARTQWKNISALNFQQFALIMEDISERTYQYRKRKIKDLQNVPPQININVLLVEYVYPKLCCYSQFQQLMAQHKIVNKNKNLRSMGGGRSTVNSQKFGSQSRFKQFNEEQQSPFWNSYEIYKKYSQKNKDKKSKINKHKKLYQATQLIQPVNQSEYDDEIQRLKKQRQRLQKQKQQQQKQKGKSCKRIIYQKYNYITNCCSKEQDQSNIIKRHKVKPWQFLAVQVIKIMEHKDSQWKDIKNVQKDYQFRLIFNNILIALFKFADLYTYLEVTLMNPKIGWQDLRQFSILLIQYRIQLYIVLFLIVICVILGIRGITFILQDRLGLTDTRIPATFPHPMYIFTMVYKLFILALFNTIIMTLLSTFMCDWASTSPPYVQIIKNSDTSIITNSDIICFSAEHNIYLICALVGILLYYPLSAYTMPNFQFSQKRLDLKYKPSYLIIYFQVNFILAAGKVLLSQIQTPYTVSTTPVQQIQATELTFQVLNIFSLFVLALCVYFIQPCLIKWFNYIELMVVLIGLTWNVLGLVLYLTGQNSRIICLVIASGITGLLLIGIPIFIKCRFFGQVKVAPQQAKQQQILQLQQNWNYSRQYNVGQVRMRNYKQMNQLQLNNNEKINSRNSQILSAAPNKQNQRNSQLSRNSKLNYPQRKSNNLLGIINIQQEDNQSSKAGGEEQESDIQLNMKRNK